MMTLVGGAIGLAAAIGIGRPGAHRCCYNLRGYDPVVLVASAVALGIVALAAGFVPAASSVAGRSHPRPVRYEWAPDSYNINTLPAAPLARAVAWPQAAAVRVIV